MSAEPSLEDLRSRSSRVRRQAEDALMAQFTPRIRMILSRVVPRAHLENAVQEALMDILRGLPGFTGDAKLSTWIYRITLRRGWKNLARAKRASDETTSPTADPVAPTRPDPLEQEDLARRLEEALTCLDWDQRSVLALTAFRGLEVAETLGIPLGTVHSRLSRARSQLKAALGASD